MQSTRKDIQLVRSMSIVLLVIFMLTGCSSSDNNQQSMVREPAVIDTRNFPDAENPETGTESDSASENNQPIVNEQNTVDSLELDSEIYLDNDNVYVRYPNTYKLEKSASVPEQFNIEVDLSPILTVEAEVDDVFLYLDAVNNSVGSIDVWYDQNDVYPTAEDLENNYPRIEYTFTDPESLIINGTFVDVRTIHNGTSTRKEYIFRSTQNEVVYIATVVAMVDIQQFEDPSLIADEQIRQVLLTMEEIVMSIEVNDTT